MNQCIFVETHQEIGFHTLSFLIPHISSTIWDNSSVSFACALTHYSMSGFIPDITLTVYPLYTFIGSIIRGQNFPDLMRTYTMKQICLDSGTWSHPHSVYSIWNTWQIKICWGSLKSVSICANHAKLSRLTEPALNWPIMLDGSIQHKLSQNSWHTGDKQRWASVHTL